MTELRINNSKICIYRSMLCVVEEPQQIFAVEKSGIYRGLYHVLGGKLSPLSGGNGEDLAIGSLLRRAEDPECKEVIIALGADVEGRATAIFLADLLKNCNVKVTRPALGLPAGRILYEMVQREGLKAPFGKEERHEND